MADAENPPEKPQTPKSDAELEAAVAAVVERNKHKDNACKAHMEYFLLRALALVAVFVAIWASTLYNATVLVVVCVVSFLLCLCYHVMLWPFLVSAMLVWLRGVTVSVSGVAFHYM